MMEIFDSDYPYSELADIKYFFEKMGRFCENGIYPSTEDFKSVQGGENLKKKISAWYGTEAFCDMVGLVYPYKNRERIETGGCTIMPKYTDCKNRKARCCNDCDRDDCAERCKNNREKCGMMLSEVIEKKKAAVQEYWKVCMR